MALLIVIGGLAVLLTALLSCPIKVKLCICAELPQKISGRMRIFWLFGLVSYRIHVSFCILEEPTLSLLYQDEGGNTKTLYRVGGSITRKEKREINAADDIAPYILKHIDVRELTVDGFVGMGDNVVGTAYLSGGLNIAFQNILALLCSEKKRKCMVAIRPVFNAWRFRLNLTCIFRFFPIQIILAALWRLIRTRKGDKIYGTSHRKHHENDNGTVKADGGR